MKRRSANRDAWQVYLALCLALVVASSATAVETPAELKQEILAYRSRIEQGKLRIRTLVDVDYRRGAHNDTAEETLDVLFRGPDLRTDYHMFRHNANRLPTVVFAECSVLANGTYIYDEVGKLHTAVNMGSFKDRDELGGAVLNHALDPRACGFVTKSNSLQSRTSLEDALGWLDLVSSLRTEELQGEETLVAEIRHMHEGRETARRVVWFAPKKGFGILRMELTTPVMNQRMTAGYHHFPGDVWYPCHLVFEELDGERVTYREINQIHADFQSPVNEWEFTLESLHLTPGRRVRDSARNFRWTGAGLTPD